MGYLNNIKKQYLISFFHSLIPAYVIERLFWQQRGMNVQMVVYCEIIYALTVTVLEIPSGILSDKFGRKKLLVLYNILAAAELMLLLFAHSFWQFAAAIFFAGVGKALSSGSENALLYDSLMIAGKKDLFEKYLGRLYAIDFSASMLAALCGGVLANFFNYEFNYILSVISMCIAALITFSLKEPPMLTKTESGISGVIPHTRQAVSIFKKYPLLLIYCLTGAVLGSCAIYLDEFWQIIMNNIGVPVLFFGVISALLLFFRIPGNLIAYKLKEKLSYRRILTCIISINTIGYAAVFFTRNLLCLIPMTIILFAAGIVDPLVSGYLHHRSDSAVRATVESISSLGLRAVSAGIGLLFGFISAKYSIFSGFLSLSVICFAGLAVFIIGGGIRYESNEDKNDNEKRLGQ